MKTTKMKATTTKTTTTKTTTMKATTIKTTKIKTTSMKITTVVTTSMKTTTMKTTTTKTTTTKTITTKTMTKETTYMPSPHFPVQSCPSPNDTGRNVKKICYKWLLRCCVTQSNALNNFCSHASLSQRRQGVNLGPVCLNTHKTMSVWTIFAHKTMSDWNIFAHNNVCLQTQSTVCLNALHKNVCLHTQHMVCLQTSQNTMCTLHTATAHSTLYPAQLLHNTETRSASLPWLSPLLPDGGENCKVWLELFATTCGGFATHSTLCTGLQSSVCSVQQSKNGKVWFELFATVCGGSAMHSTLCTTLFCTGLQCALSSVKCVVCSRAKMAKCDLRSLKQRAMVLRRTLKSVLHHVALQRTAVCIDTCAMWSVLCFKVCSKQWKHTAVQYAVSTGHWAVWRKC